jgi:hypothetical protein
MPTMFKVQPLEELRYVDRSQIILNGKSFTTPFTIFTPKSKPDKDIICENILKSSSQKSFIDFMGATAYRIFEHDMITRGIGRTIVNRNIDRAFVHLNQTRFKFIEMSMDSIRNGYRTYFNGFLALENIPAELREYLSDVRNKSDSLHNLSMSFWEDLIHNSRAVYFENWADKIQAKRLSDIFIPAIPHITLDDAEALTRMAIEINEDCQELVSRDTAIVFSLDASVLSSRRILMRILNAIAELKQSKLCLFKIQDWEVIKNYKYGEASILNLELFLKSLKGINEGRIDNRIQFGMLNGEAFGYALLGTEFGMFQSYVGNYQDYLRSIKGRPKKHRACINPDTLVLETFEGCKTLFTEHGKIVPTHHPDGKYNNITRFDEQTIDRNEWSKDCRLVNITMWNEYTKELVDSVRPDKKYDSLFFDKIQNSAFSSIATVLRNVNNVS